MAVILKLGKKYQVTYEVVTPTKEIKMIKELFDHYEDAVKRKELLDGETCVFSPDSLFVDVMKDWLNDPYFVAHIHKHREASKNFDTYLQNYLGTIRVSEMNEDYAQALIGKICTTQSVRYKKELSTKTTRSCKLLLSETCDHAIQLGIMDSNPFIGIHISNPSAHKREKKSADWTYETMNMIFEECKEEKLYVIMQIIFATGLNVLDVLGLCWADYYKEKGKAYIRSNKSLRRLARSSVELIPKQRILKQYTSEDSTRTFNVLYYKEEKELICIPNALYKLLMQWKKRCNEIYQFDTDSNALMFTTHGVAPYDDRLMLKHLRQITDKLKLPRHTLKGLKAFSKKVEIDGRSYRDIYYFEHDDISFDYHGLTPKEKAVTLNEEFTESMKKNLPDKDKKDAVDLVKQLSEDKNIRKKLLMKLLEIESGE